MWRWSIGLHLDGAHGGVPTADPEGVEGLDAPEQRAVGSELVASCDGVEVAAQTSGAAKSDRRWASSGGSGS
jgi:hypothetical protein